MPPETLVEGPSRTGKSLGIGLALADICHTQPNTKILIVRKTLKSMRESVLATWEEEVLPTGHEALKANNRHSQQPRYEFSNGSLVIATGFNGPEDVERIKSSEWDIVWVNEATDITVNDWEIMLTRLSGKQKIGKFAIADVNPVAPTHWLNQRAKTEMMSRIVTTLDDNPRFVDQKTGKYTEDGESYVAILDNLTGVRYKRLRKGLWAAAEGAIWPNFDPEIHCIDKIPVDKDGDSVIRWYFGGVDWGWKDPGTLNVYGVDDFSRMYVVHEVYRSNENIEWWAEQAAKLQKTYDLRTIVCDPSRPDNIDLFNHRLYQSGDRNCAIKANNAIDAGLSVVRERFESGSLYILNDSRVNMDKDLAAASQPTCLVDEIPGYEYREVQPGQRSKEEPRLDSVDHSCDNLRYACLYLDYSKYTEKKRPHKRRGTELQIWVEDDIDATMAEIKRSL